jgi:iron complex outermembrane receptor protein
MYKLLPDGETGADISSIPTDAIEREILRDGASAQYGSDAIAGVMNITKKSTSGGSGYLCTGITTEGDVK